MNGVDVGFALPSALDADQSGAFKFADKLGHAGPAHAHVNRQPILAGKTRIVVPRIAQKHGVSHFRTGRQIGIFQNEIWNLGEASLQHGIDRVQLQILLLEDFPDVFHVCYNYSTRPENPILWIT